MRAIALKARVPPLFLREQYKGLGFWFGAQVIDATILSLLFLLITNMILRTVFAHAWTTPLGSDFYGAIIFGSVQFLYDEG